MLKTVDKLIKLKEHVSNLKWILYSCYNGCDNYCPKPTEVVNCKSANGCKKWVETTKVLVNVSIRWNARNYRNINKAKVS